MKLTNFLKMVSKAAKDKNYKRLPENIEVNGRGFKRDYTNINAVPFIITYYMQYETISGVKVKCENIHFSLSRFLGENYVLSDFANINVKFIKEDILTNKEKEYLTNVIKPFRCNVIDIKKRKYLTEQQNAEYITIYTKNEDDGYYDLVGLPHFEKETYFKKMKIDKAYTLKELDL